MLESEGELGLLLLDDVVSLVFHEQEIENKNFVTQKMIRSND
jgi:hypothetical protein